MVLGYDPDRVRLLSQRTAAAIAQLRAIRSADPSAIDALDAIRLTRRNLEDHWMPTLRSIQASEALLDWTPTAGRASHRGGPARAGGRRRGRPTEYARLTDDSLFDVVTALANRFVTTDDPAEHPTTAELTSVALELGRRAAFSDETAERLVAIAAHTPIVAMLTGLAPFPPDVTGRILISSLAVEPWPSAGAVRRHLAGIEAAMSALIEHPGGCLDVLLDEASLTTLAGPSPFDDGLVQEFATSGLYDAVAVDPDRLLDGHLVLAALTRLANGPLDGGFNDGMARAVGVSMSGYIDTLAPAIRQEGDHPVLIIADGGEVELGTYDDVVDLLGAVLRDEGAQAAVGSAIGGYAVSLVDELGTEVTTRPGLERLARFADLVGDATRAEQAELVMAAASEEAARRRLGGSVGFGLTAAITAAGAGVLLRSTTGRAISAVTDRLATVDHQRMPGSSIPAATYDIITITSLALVVRDHSTRRPLGLGAVSAGQWTAVAERLGEIERTDDHDERRRQVIRLDRWVEDSSPDLARYLADVRARPGVDELTEARNAVAPD